MYVKGSRTPALVWAPSMGSQRSRWWSRAESSLVMKPTVSCVARQPSKSSTLLISLPSGLCFSLSLAVLYAEVFLRAAALQVSGPSTIPHMPKTATDPRYGQDNGSASGVTRNGRDASRTDPELVNSLLPELNCNCSFKHRRTFQASMSWFGTCAQNRRIFGQGRSSYAHPPLCQEVRGRTKRAEPQ